MQLTKLERLILANQYRILASTDPQNADSYETMREALEWGYEAGYSGAIDQMSDGVDSDQCNFVTKTMAMYGAIQQSYAALSADERGGIEEWRTEFPGFDGNNETEYMGYAQFVVRREQRFQYLNAPDGLNSHMPMVSTYRAMLARWQQCGDSHRLSREDLLTLLQ